MWIGRERGHQWPLPIYCYAMITTHQRLLILCSKPSKVLCLHEHLKLRNGAQSLKWRESVWNEVSHQHSNPFPCRRSTTSPSTERISRWSSAANREPERPCPPNTSWGTVVGVWYWSIRKYEVLIDSVKRRWTKPNITPNFRWKILDYAISKTDIRSFILIKGIKMKFLWIGWNRQVLISPLSLWPAFNINNSDNTKLPDTSPRLRARVRADRASNSAYSPRTR